MDQRAKVASLDSSVSKDSEREVFSYLAWGNVWHLYCFDAGTLNERSEVDSGTPTTEDHSATRRRDSY
jgi:hypothetical protein